MVLEDGASLSQIGLTSRSVLELGAPAGAASVDRFQSDSAATLKLSIGGPIAGSQHDLLIVTGGGAALAGNLEVALDGGFAPHAGDEFTVLTAVGGVTGTFVNQPVTHAGGMTYRWQVLYNPNTVVLRVQSAEPACYANCDDSTTAPILNVADFICFVNRFGSGDNYANCDQSMVPPVLNVLDFQCFLNKFQSGCS
jgi:hypothetical protein